MLKKIVSYENKNGNVYLFKETKGFSVLMEKRICPGNFRCKAFSTENYEIAIDKYKECIELLNGRNPVCQCVSNPNRRRRCTAKNCPKKLGGEDYWRIFRESCLYRTR